MAHVELAFPIQSMHGILIRSDPYYIRRYPAPGGGVMHIVQARPDRSTHTPTEAERQTRIAFAQQYGRQRHEEYMERCFRNQLEIPFGI